MKNGFPWHRPDEPHPELSDPERWWAAITPLLLRAVAGAGVRDPAQAEELAQAVRARLIDSERGWRMFDDTRAALETTGAGGWLNVILSNHVPELPQLVTGLGLDGLVDRVFTSATMGYEKPHPEAFRHVLREAGDPARRWMVGDNPVADVEGAEALGIPALLVRNGETGLRDALAAAVHIVAS